jgi:hypothetical protein
VEKRILGRLASARPCFPKGQPARGPHALVARGGPQSSQSKPRLCRCLQCGSTAIAHGSSVFRAAFAHLHCIAFPWVHVDLRTTRPHSASRLRYLALAPTYALLQAAAYSSQCVISWSPPPPPPHTTHSPASITYRDLPRPLRVSALLPVSEPTLPLFVFPLVCPPPTCWF